MKQKKLSKREFQVLNLINQGNRNFDIAIALRISVKTVSTYKNRIYEKLGLGTDWNIIRLIDKARALGLIFESDNLYTRNSTK